MKKIKKLFYKKKCFMILFFCIGQSFLLSNNLVDYENDCGYKNNQQYIYINFESEIIVAAIKVLQEFARNDNEVKMLNQLYYRLNEGHKTASKQMLIDALTEAMIIITNNYHAIQENKDCMLFVDHLEQLLLAINSNILSVKKKHKIIKIVIIGIY